ncbi:putative mitochondrial 30s ribosomal protein s10 [Erysiphe necator]|uniref:Small ribosomal subunit protein uS10m n=1 Tax=Uncinula necator TaxID=52586 RepID=A0A0B1P102_UNCNE|nr:putative mitochondrial 30s ribosomal protein s10 [Erysiphe necator]
MASYFLRRKPWSLNTVRRLNKNWVKENFVCYRLEVLLRPYSASSEVTENGTEKIRFVRREYKDERYQSRVANNENSEQENFIHKSPMNFSDNAHYAYISFEDKPDKVFQESTTQSDPSKISIQSASEVGVKKDLQDSQNHDDINKLEEFEEFEEDPTPRPPRAVQAAYLRPLRRKAPFNIPVCDLQLRSYSVQNLQFMADFALRAAYFLNLPASGPVPLPQITERWTVPKAHFIHKKIQENFERKTLRRLIQIKDGDPEVVRLWLGFLRKHAYYGVGMKANVYEFASINVIKDMDAAVEQNRPEIEPLLAQYAFREGSQYGEKIIEVANQENRWQASGGSAPMINTPDWRKPLN